jgi:predicted Zn-dependent protease
MRYGVLLLATISLLTGCATSPEGRTQVVAPQALQGFSAVYSEFDMHLQLVIAANSASCQNEECAADRAFDLRILALGGRLADIAYRQHADLHLRFPRFEFVVADKADAGAASSAGGTVVIYRGVRLLKLDDAALAFVMAREMSHVIGGHHDENVTASILVAVAAQILFPVLNIARGLTAATTAATTTAAASTVVSTSAVASAASFAGSRALRASYRPQQVVEAEMMAMKLLVATGWDGREVSDQLEALRPALPEDPFWIEELRDSARRMASLMQGPQLPEAPGAVGAVGRITPDLGQIKPALPSDLPLPIVRKPF